MSSQKNRIPSVRDRRAVPADPADASRSRSITFDGRKPLAMTPIVANQQELEKVVMAGPNDLNKGRQPVTMIPTPTPTQQPATQPTTPGPSPARKW
jgi:hypothetical protein